MTTVKRRRQLSVSIAFLLLLVTLAALSVVDLMLLNSAHVSGWVLFAIMLLLTGLNVRKKLSVLPFSSVANWLQIHIYAGALGLIVFALHVGLGVPRGWLELAMALGFALVSLSGVVGILLSRVLPVQLTTRGEAIVFDRIPILLARLRQRAEALVVESAKKTGERTVADFYLDRLAPFFAAPRHLASHFLQLGHEQRQLLEEIAARERYATDEEAQYLHQLASLVRAKSDLDYQFSLQLALKAWLFVHVPLSYALWLLIGLHVVLVHAFSGGA